MVRQFSRTYPTFGDWASIAPQTAYTVKIRRMHGIHPTATLTQLRRHPGAIERPLGVLRRAEVHRRGWDILTAREKEYREKSMKAVSLMRRHGYSLARASREAGTTPETVRRHTRATKRIDGRWRPKAFYRVSRVMRINENGAEVLIEVTDSRHASMIGRYHAAVREFLRTGDASHLRPFRGKKVRDAQGNWHTLETDVDKLYEIEEGREEEEYFTIYSS